MQFPLTSAGLGPIGTAIDTLAGGLEKTANAGLGAYRSFTGAGNPLSDPDGPGQKNYDTSSSTFPLNITNSHYMMININVSVWSMYSGGTDSDQYSTADINRASMKGTDGYVARRNRRIAKTVCLYMPNTVVFTQANHYEDISLTGIIGSGLQMGAGLVSKTLAGWASKAASMGQTAAGILGSPINPKTEVIFSNVALRTFQFDFLFAPTSQQEADALSDIIKTLRFHTAPELGDYKGFLWVPPSEFDIKFFKDDGSENENIPKISTCVMENLDVDYAPTGIYSTFSNGYPVSVRIAMRLKEVEVLHKELVRRGY